MSRMRMLLSRPGYQDGDALREAIASELDNLTDVLTDAYQRVDGMVDDESYTAACEGFQDEIGKLEDELRDREAECEKLGGVVAELQDQLKASPDQLRVDNAELVAEKAGHDAEIERARGMAKREKENADRYAREASEANRERNAALARKTATETADHYREKYEAAVKREEAFAQQVSAAFTNARGQAGKRKAVLEGIRMVEDAYRYSK
jgi:chromosome segregation ATPase